MKKLILFFVASLVLFAQPAANEQDLANSGGDAVSIDGGWAVVGAAADSKVHIFKLDYSKMQNTPMDMWTEQQPPLNGASDTAFGTSVVVDGKSMLVGVPRGGQWHMESATAALKKYQQYSGEESFTSISFNQQFKTVPVVFILTADTGGDPAYVRITNVTTTGFKAAPIETPGTANPNHVAMNVHYLAIEEGRHTLPNGQHIIVGKVDTKDYHATDDNGTRTAVKFGDAFTNIPIVIAHIQTTKNQPALNGTDTPAKHGDPWMTVLVEKIDTEGFSTALEVSKTGTESNITVKETIGWLAIEEGQGSFNDTAGTQIDFSVVKGTGVRGKNNGTGCFYTSFNASYDAATVKAVATKNTANGNNGGWLRKCDLNGTDVGVYVEEDATSNGKHMNEDIGVLAFSDSFSAALSPGAGEVRFYRYNADSGAWEERAVISPDNTTGEIAFGSTVALQEEGAATRIAVGAPGAYNANGSTGKVYTYNWDGTTLNPGTVLSGGDYAKLYGASIDMKDDHLIVGAPASGQPGQDNYVGSAYTYSFDGSTWVEYPSAVYYRIKRNIANEKLGTSVAIENGNAVVSTTPSALAGSWRYEVNSAGTAWVETTHFYPGSDAHGVDMDNNITLSTSSTDTVRFYINDLNHTKYSSYSDMEVTTSTTTGALDSVQLYKDQAIISDPGNDQAVVLDIPCGIRPTELKKNEWAMISIPCGDGTASIGALFNGQLGSSYGDSGTWVMYEQNDTDYSGTSSSMQMMGVNDPMLPGKGYWIITDDDRLLEAQSITTRTPLDTATGITAEPVGGFFVRALPDSISGTTKKIMVGNPFPRAFKWQYLYININNNWYPFDDETNIVYHRTGYVYDVDAIASGQPYRAITASGTPGFSDEIKPYQGVWIKDLGAYDMSGLKLGFPFMK